MASVTFGGLASGIDTKQLVTDLMAIERAPLTALKTKQTDLGSAKTTLASLMASFAAVKTAASALTDPTKLEDFTVSSSGNGVVATTFGSPTPASFNVQVTKLAQAQRTQSALFDSATTALDRGGTLSITAGSAAAVNVTIHATDTLTDIAARLNTEVSSISASVVYDGAKYRMIVAAKDTGASHAVVFGGSADLGLDADGANYRPAQNAHILLDGEIDVERATNQFNDVIPGVKLTAKAEMPAPETITVAADPDSLTKKVQALVDAYNKANAAANVAVGFGSIKASNPNLAGDSMVRQGLSSMLSSVTAKFTNVTGRYNMLAAIGVHSDTGGNLVFDKVAFADARQKNPDAVSTLLAGDAAHGVSGAMARLTKVVEALTEGDKAAFKTRIDVFTKRIDALGTQQETLSARLDSYQTQLEKRFTAMELLVSKIKAQGNALAGFVTSSTTSG